MERGEKMEPKTTVTVSRKITFLRATILFFIAGGKQVEIGPAHHFCCSKSGSPSSPPPAGLNFAIC
jgi:hypothetical protein